MPDMPAEVDVEGIFKAATDKAVLIECQGQDIWIPKSEIIDSDPEIDSLERGDKVTLTIPKWLAQVKELD